MPRAYGSNAQLLLLEEISYGVLPVGDFNKMPFISCALGSEQPLLADDTIGNGRDPLPPSQDVITVSGDIVVPADVRNLGFWLKGALGTPVDAAGPPDTHTFTSGAAALPSFAIEVGLSQASYFAMNLGCLVNSLAFSFTPQGTSRVTASVLAQGETIAATTGGGTPTTKAYKRFSQFQGSVKKGGAALGNVTSGSLTYTNNADAVRVIRSDGKIAGVDPTIAAATGQIGVRFADTDLMDDATAGTAIALEFAYTIDANSSLVITLPAVYLPKPKIQIQGPGGVEATFDFQAAKDATAGYMLQAVLTNDVASY